MTLLAIAALFGQSLDFSTVAQGSWGLNEPWPQALVVKSRADATRVGARVQTDLRRSLSLVDYRRNVVLVVSLGTRPSGGYAVTIRSVRVVRGQFCVDVVVREPQPGEAVIAALTVPYHAVRLRRSGTLARTVPRDWVVRSGQLTLAATPGAMPGRC